MPKYDDFTWRQQLRLLDLLSGSVHYADYSHLKEYVGSNAIDSGEIAKHAERICRHRGTFPKHKYDDGNVRSIGNQKRSHQEMNKGIIEDTCSHPFYSARDEKR